MIDDKEYYEGYQIREIKANEIQSEESETLEKDPL